MRIALVGAEFEENLAVRYIWGALEAAGHEVVQVVFNDRAELEGAARELAASQTALAGFSMVFTYRAREFADLATRARELGYRGHMVAGGHFAAFNAEALLRDVPAFDLVGIGEGEEILVELAAHVGDLAAVRGLVWRDAAGRVVRNAPAAKPPDLDALPYPRRKQPFDAYLGIPIVNMLSSRGCTHACAFCSIAAWHKLCGGRRFRLRRPEAVADEMAALYEQGVRIFNFHDDNFFLGSTARSFERVRALKQGLDRRGVGRVAFAVKARPDSVDEELFAYLKEMGLFRVFLGVEAGTAESLSRLGRGQTRSDNEHALEVVNRLDLHACFNLLMLNPHSTLEDFAANLAFLRQHPHNPMNFCRTEIYAGTPLEARLRAEGRLLGDYWGYDYVIADPRAQRLFELVYPVFRERNYADDGLHHRTMSVDYEYHLLAHFLGADEGLRRRVKDYTLAVNLNTCGHLEAVVAAVAEGATASDLALVDAMRARVVADNRSLAAESDRLLDAIRAAARRKSSAPRTGWMQKAVAAGLAATVTLAAADAAERGTQPTEPAPIPPRPPGTHVCEMAPRPSFILRSHVIGAILPRLSGRLAEPAALAVEGHLDAQGRVVAIELRDAKLKTPVAVFIAPALPVFGQPGKKSIALSFTLEQVRQALAVGAKWKVATGKAGVVMPRFRQQVLPTLARGLRAAADIHVELWLDAKGKLTHAAIYGATLSDDGRAKLADRLRSLHYTDVKEAHGKRFWLSFPKNIIQLIRKPPTHIFEMIAPRTHPKERAPMPPKKR